MGDSAPGPDPIRAIYGFVLYLGTLLSFGLYLLWAFLPDSWLNTLGLTYLPARHWVLTAPVYCFVLLLFVIVSYVAYNLTTVPSLDSWRTITDEHALSLPESADICDGFYRKGDGVPPIADIPIQSVNRRLYDTVQRR